MSFTRDLPQMICETSEWFNGVGAFVAFCIRGTDF